MLNDTRPKASSDVTPDERGKRRYGTGGIERRTPQGPFRGRYRDAAGTLVRLPWCASLRDAEEQLQAAMEMMGTDGNLSVGAITLRKWGEQFLDARELEGHRASEADRSRWRYILLADFIDWPLTSIGRKDIKQWMTMMNTRRTYGRAQPQSKKSKKASPKPTAFLNWQTKTHALNLLRRAFARAIEEEKAPVDFANPCIGFTFKRPPRVMDPWNYLTREEIVALQKVAPPLLRPIIEFAIATGLRAGEMRALHLEDVHAEGDTPYITVRYGKPPRKPTKSGHPREVPLLPMALRALREWTAIRDQWCTENDKGLVFPAQRGGHRSEGKMLGRRHQKTWRDLLRQAAIQKPLVWHDLRHTCGTALLGGYFGRKWRLEEIQQLLGHADVKTTERYAHALKQTLHDAARETGGDINGKP